MAAAEVFANQPTTTVSSGGTDAPSSGTVESWTVASSASFPSASTGVTQFHVCDTATGSISEIIAVTNVSGTTWTVTRGAESTTPVTHIGGFTIQQVVTAGFLGEVVVNPMTATGDTLYGGASGVPSRLAGNTSAVRQFYSETGTGSAGAAPAWGTITAADVPGFDGVNVSGVPSAGYYPRASGATTATWGTITASDVPGFGGVNVPGTASAGWYPRGVSSSAGAWGPIQAADLPAATTSVQGAVEFGGSVASIQPSPATGALGASGLVPDLTHVHPQPPMFAPTGLTGATAASRYVGATASGLPQSGTFAVGDLVLDQAGASWVCVIAGSAPTNGQFRRMGDHSWQFRPESYGAKGDGKFVSDGAITSGLNTLTCATSTPFQATDVGKYILVWAANTSTTFLFTTIATYVSASQVTLTANAGNTVTASGVAFATDDTAAIQACINAANTHSVLGNGTSAIVEFSDKIYGVASPAVLGTTTGGGNWQITLPVVTPGSSPKSQIVLNGTDVNQLPHWLQTVPSQSGTILLGMRTDGSLNNTYGPTSVIGGPVSGYGGGGGTFSNMHLRVKGVSIMVPAVSTAYSGLEIYGLGQASIDSYSYLPLGVVPSTQPWPTLAIAGVPAYSYGLRMPAPGNNAVSDIGYYTCYFTQISLIASEHTTVTSMKTLYSVYGWLPMNASGTMAHGITIQNWACEETTNVVGTVSSGFFHNAGPIGVSVMRVSLESYTHIVNDAAANLFGDIGFDIINSATTLLATQYSGAAQGVKLRQIAAAQGIVGSPPAVPATTVAQLNGYYRDAWVNVQPNGATVTAISTGTAPTAYTGITSGFAPVVSGGLISVAYSGGTPTWQWILF